MIFICYDCGNKEEKSGQNGVGDCDSCDGRKCVYLEEES